MSHPGRARATTKELMEAGEAPHNAVKGGRDPFKEMVVTEDLAALLAERIDEDSIVRLRARLLAEPPPAPS